MKPNSAGGRIRLFNSRSRFQRRSLRFVMILSSFRKKGRRRGTLGKEGPLSIELNLAAQK